MEDVVTAIDILNIFVAGASIILAIVAIWLSVVFYKSSSQSEKNVEIAINKIGEATDTLSKISLRMIGKLTNALVTPRTTETATEELLKAAKNSGLLKSYDEKDGNLTKSELEQFRVDNLITALYYSGLSNMALQSQLPPTIGETQGLSVANLVDQSKADYDTLSQWLMATDNITSKVKASPVQHMYSRIREVEGSVRSTRDYYASLDQAVGTGISNEETST